MKARYLVVCCVVVLLGAALIGAGTNNASPVNSGIDIKNRDVGPAPILAEEGNTKTYLGISEYLNQYHEHDFGHHQREAVVVIKFPSCEGTIGRVFEFLDSTSNKDQISILGIKDKGVPVYTHYKKYYDSPKVSFRNHTDHLKQATNISIDYPELYLFENGSEKEHQTANCNNFESVISDLETFLAP